MISRRHALLLPAAAALGACANLPVTETSSMEYEESTHGALASTIVTYAGFGAHFSGSAGDLATTDWLDRELLGAGYETRRQTFEVPSCDGETGSVTLSDGTSLSGPIQAPGKAIETRAELVHWHADLPPPELGGKLVVYHARFGRHSSLMSPEWQRVLKAAREAQSAGIVAITHGPTRLAIRLNAPADIDLVPMLTISPANSAALRVAAQGQTAHLSIAPARPTRLADNLIARRKGSGPRIVVSTPKSGWGICASERGPGIAIFLMLARTLAASLPDADMHLVATSGHEYENLGAHKFLESAAPEPAETALWVHLGANLSAVDFHDLGPSLLPIPSPDPQRYLGATKGLDTLAREIFNGRPGLEAAYAMSAEDAAGELSEILAVGYASAFGAFGAGRFHHTDQDTPDKVDLIELAATGSAFLRMVHRAIG
ncbi:hypothetical protein [uncultured Hyphomonas sp.]|jgi:hypothetical protein|uniref:hypothetical protein n=1 Tax=uncultured Hyphomonas sp. TaxID=225298 RepID=UPI0026C535D3|nr:hypothetical protein [Henriciella sp.]